MDRICENEIRLVEMKGDSLIVKLKNCGERNLDTRHGKEEPKGPFQENKEGQLRGLFEPDREG